MEPTDQDYGSRDFSVRDPEGNIWAFGTYAPSQLLAVCGARHGHPQGWIASPPHPRTCPPSSCASCATRRGGAVGRRPAGAPERRQRRRAPRDLRLCDRRRRAPPRGFDISSDRPGHLQRVLQGELPDGHAERSKEKPDLEALTLLPPFEGNPYGAPRARFGIGTAPRPRFRLRPGADGGLAGEPREISLEPVYSLLREHVRRAQRRGRGDDGDRLWLLQRQLEVGSNLVAELARRGDALAA